MGISDRHRRMAANKPESKALEEAAENRKGWQFDPRTGDAHLIMSALGARESSLGCIAYVRANPKEGDKAYESIVKAPNGFAQYPGDHDDPKEILVIVERWLQSNLLGIAADKAASEERETFREFLISHMGEDKGKEAWKAYLAYLV